MSSNDLEADEEEEDEQQLDDGQEYLQWGIRNLTFLK